MNEVEDRIRAALAARAAVTEPSYDAIDVLSDRIGLARRTRRLQAIAAAAVLVVLAVALPFALTRLGDRHSGAPPASPVTQRPGTPARIPATPVPDALLADGEHLWFAAVGGGRMTILDPVTGQPSVPGDVPGAEAIAGLGGGGWLMAHRSGNCAVDFRTVMPDGRVRSPWTMSLSGVVTAMEDSDNNALALVMTDCDGTSPRLGVVDLLAGRVKWWELPTGAEQIDGLSWQADKVHLAYVVHRGNASAYGLLDTSAAPGLLTGVRPHPAVVDAEGQQCVVRQPLWLGETGDPAVIAACPDGSLKLVALPPHADPLGGAAIESGQVTATVPAESDTKTLSVSATWDGRYLMLTTDTSTYRIGNGLVARFADRFASASW